MVHEMQFESPVVLEGKEYSGLTLDFSRVTGLTLIECERRFKQETGGAVEVALNDYRYVSLVAGEAAGMAVELIRALPAPYFIAAMLHVQSFLLSAS